MKILVTGFTPFNKETINPSYEAIKLLDDTINNASIYKLEVETSFTKAFEMVKEKIDEIKPDVVINVGQAGGRSTITLEKVAINLMDCKIADNDGNMYEDKKILIDGPDAYFTTLDIVAIKKYLASKNKNVNISYSAGTFVCNYLMYQVLNYCKDKNIKADFIHVPFATNQVIDNKYPSMSIKDMALELKLIIEYITK